MDDGFVIDYSSYSGRADKSLNEAIATRDDHNMHILLTQGQNLTYDYLASLSSSNLYYLALFCSRFDYPWPSLTLDEIAVLGVTETLYDLLSSM